MSKTGSGGEACSPPASPVSVVIPTRGRPARLDAAVRAVLADPSTSEVIVVVDGEDQAATNKTVERLRAFDGRVTALSQAQAGASVARQQGLERAAGDVVLFLDDDVVADPGLVTGHARHHETARGVGAIVVGYLRTELPARRRPGDFATFLYRLEYEQACAAYETNIDAVLDALWAGNFSMRRADALSVGLVEPRAVLTYHADTAIGWRARASGLGGVFDRTLSAQHVHSRSLRAFLRDARAQGVDLARLAQVAPAGMASPADQRPEPPTLTRGLLWISRRQPGHFVVVQTLAFAVVVAGRLRWWSVEMRAAVLARAIEHGWGMRHAG